MTQRLFGVAVALALALVMATTAHARTSSKKQKQKISADNIVTVSTAAGLDISVASTAANRFQGFIADVVARGYKPKQIHCFAKGGHVRNSNHYRGMACDFDQSGWNKTARAMYRVADLAKKWGLRDGCTFRDCGHVDIPTARKGHEPVNLYAATERFHQQVAAAQTK